MQLNQRIAVLLLMILIPLFGQVKKMEGSKSAKKKNEIINVNTAKKDELIFFTKCWSSYSRTDYSISRRFWSV